MEQLLHKIDYYKDANIHAQLHCMDKYVMIHCTLKKLTASVIRKLYSVYGAFLNEMKQFPDKEVLIITPQPRLAQMFNFQYSTEIEYDGVKYEVYKCRY